MIIGVTGKKRAGKDTAAEALVREGFILYRFADALKKAAAEIFLWDDEWINGKYKETVDSRWGISPREAQQLIGTELFREALPEKSSSFAETVGNDIWVMRFMYWVRGFAEEPNIVIPDVRFLNEAEAIKALGGYIIRINRPGYGGADLHSSETEMDSIEADCNLKNSGSIKDLQEFTKAFVDLRKADIEETL